MFDKYKRDSQGRFAPTYTGKKNVPNVNTEALSGSIEWRRTKHSLSKVLPSYISANDFLPCGKNRNPNSGFFDGFIMLNGKTFEVKTRKHHSATIANGFESTHVVDLYTTGFGKKTIIRQPSQFVEIFRDK